MDAADVCKRKLLKNLIDIKDTVSVNVEAIVDSLIENEVVPWEVKDELDSIQLPQKKVEHVLRLVIKGRVKAYDVFIRALVDKGCRPLAQKIEETDLTDQERKEERRQKELTFVIDTPLASARSASEMPPFALLPCDFRSEMLDMKNELKREFTIQINEMNTHIEQSNEEDREKIAQLQKSQKDMRAKANEDNSRIVALHKENVLLKSQHGDSEELKQEMHNLKEEHAQLRKENEEQIKQLQQQLDLVKEEKDEQTKQLKAELTTITREKKELQNQLKQQEGKFEQRLKEKENENVDLQRKIEWYKQQNESLKTVNRSTTTTKQRYANRRWIIDSRNRAGTRPVIKY